MAMHTIPVLNYSSGQGQEKDDVMDIYMILLVGTPEQNMQILLMAVRCSQPLSPRALSSLFSLFTWASVCWTICCPGIPLLLSLCWLLVFHSRWLGLDLHPLGENKVSPLVSLSLSVSLPCEHVVLVSPSLSVFAFFLLSKLMVQLIWYFKTDI